MTLDEKISEFLSNYYHLSDKDKYQLKRSFGKSLSDSSILSQMIFYSLLPEEEVFKDTLYAEILFFVATVEAYYGNYKGTRIEPRQLLPLLAKGSSDSYQNRVKHFVSNKITLKNHYLNHLTSYIRQGKTKKHYVDAYKLAKDLLCWNGKEKCSYTQKTWIKELLKGRKS